MKRPVTTFLSCFLSAVLLCTPALAIQTNALPENDTINQVDENNLKQGYWIYVGSMKTLPGYAPDQKVEEGPYQDNRKSGLWVKYFPNSKVETEITFTNNRPTGPYKVYYENGQVMEEGFWKNNRNIGTFTRFYENGEKHQEFSFNETGKREGSQKYYHENGQLMIEGDWAAGKEAGELKEYYANGELRSVKYFNEGSMDEAKTQNFEPKQPIVETPIESEEPEKAAPVVTPQEKKNIGYFSGEGFHTLYNRNKQISQKGFFKKGRLMDGKWYRYNRDGILETIEIYKGGKYIGNGVIEEDDL